MPQIHTLAEANLALRPFYDYSRTAYTLDVMKALMEHLGNPQNQLRVLHVAGTSGKTSTAYYCAALLKEAGKKVGLSVSPHVDTVNERLQINGQPMPEAEFCKVLSEFLDVVAESGIKPSYFELLVAMTYWEFARQKVDYAVIEVGLGGLRDGTNVIERADKVCLITDIGLDHTEILGNTLTKITGEKAGIIREGNDVFMYQQASEVMRRVEKTVADKQATLHVLQGDATVHFANLPLFQQRNLGLASQAVDYVLRRDYQERLIHEIQHRAAEVNIPARLERFTVNNKLVIVDGSHNQQKLETLFESIEQLYPGRPIAVLCAFVKGSEERWQGGLGVLMVRVQHIIFTSFQAEQDAPKSSVDPEELQQFCREHEFAYSEIMERPADAYSALLARSEPVLLVTGSFYLLNHIRPLIEKHA